MYSEEKSPFLKGRSYRRENTVEAKSEKGERKDLAESAGDRARKSTDKSSFIEYR